jgi:hypothetical protein
MEGGDVARKREEEWDREGRREGCGMEGGT